MLDKDFFSRYNEIYGKDKELEGIPGFQMNKPVAYSSYKGRIGLELEIEANSSTPNEGHLDALVSSDTKARWSAIRDGSLRGDYAREYIVNRPINREELRPMLEGLFTMFKTMKSTINNSNRCSTHVHLNMGGKKVNEITAVICLWTIFEKSLINFCGEERQTNHFALSSSESAATLTAWENYLRYGHNHWDRNLKYQAMNILPLFNKGSLEIRCGAAADNAEGPIVWATLLDHLVDFAIERYSKGIPLIGSDISERGSASLFEELCSRDPILVPVYNKIISDNGGNELFNDSCLRGFRNCQSLVYGFPWESWHKMIEKEYVPDPFSKEVPTNKISRRGFARLIPLEINIPAPDPDNERRQPDVIIPIQTGDRVRYVRGTQRRIGAEGTVDRIEGTNESPRCFIRWDNEVNHPIRWCHLNQIEFTGRIHDEVELEAELDDIGEWAHPR